ncbi:MAG: YMGG-like glycine zipper-containing protein [Ginsengibacter sp.]
MKIIKKISLPVLMLFAFTACKNNQDQTRNIQLLPDSSAYNNNSSTDSIKMDERNTAEETSTYRYHPNAATHKTTTERNTSTTSTVSKSPSTTSTSTTQSTTQTTKKKGWSKAAQGAVIGGAAGAVGGAIISKHKGTGAAIGAAVGAAGGYIIGRHKDKKDGRY